MRTFNRLSGLLLFLAFCQPAVSQEIKWPNTLLWKIERADLKKPSFLFGTMHLQDKRIFNLGDSFYHHFEKAEGFAIEVDFNEYMDSILQKAFREVEDRELNTDDEVEDVNADDLDSARAIIDSIIREGPPPAMSKSLRKQYRKLRNERIRRLLVHGEMPTILDAYLYGMAMKQGKWLGAVEDVKDQMNLRDEIGKDIAEKDYLLEEDGTIFSLESMIKTYIAQDLNTVEQYINRYGTPKSKTLMFNNRNVKMTHSIDSLSHLRSMFYAVGAAHLPGDSGVIRLLRDQGYTVTPVFSGKTLAAEKYAAKLPALGWYEIGQTDSLYTIDMPGIPSEFNLFGELVKMKVFVDITTMTYYMTGHTIAQFSDDKLHEALKGMAQSMNGTGKTEQVRKFDRDGMKGIEGLVNSGGTNFRIQVLKKNNIAFFLMIGGDKKAGLLAADAGKFFNSFRLGGGTKTKTPKDWKEFGIPEKAFTVMMPDIPKRNVAFEKQAYGSGWTFTVYDCTDLVAGLYYVIQVRDIDAGMYLDGDSTYFGMFRDNLTGNDVKLTRDDRSVLQGFPALRLDGISAKDAMFYKTRNIVRGNRVYSMLVLGHESKMDEAASEQFLSSLQLTGYIPAPQASHTAADKTFSSRVPAEFKLAEKEPEDDSTRVHYTSYNPNDAVSYEVIKDQMPELYWSENDSVFYNGKFSSMRSYADSVVSNTKTRNGSLEGMEEIVRLPGSNILKRVRMFLHSDTLYTLMTFVPEQYFDQPEHTAFFEKFRVLHDDRHKTTVFTKKAQQLFDALLENDSAKFEQASWLLGNNVFTKEDLPLLHPALLRNYADDSLTYGNVKSKLINILDGLSDSSTVDYIVKHYDEIGNRGDEKVNLLQVLSNTRTEYAYRALKDLFIKKTPTHLKNRKSISYKFTDSLELAKLLYPEMMELFRNSDYWEDVSDYTAELFDSSMVDLASLRKHEKDILHIADTVLKGTAITEESWGWRYTSLVKLLGYLDSDASAAMLKRYVAQPDIFLKKAAIIALMKNGKVADTKEIEKVAMDNEYRRDLYDELMELGKASHYPVKYLTQRYFAESAIYNYDEEDYDPSSIQYLGERETVFNNEKKRFFLFRLGYEDEDGKETEAYLGMAGPYSLDAKDLKTTSDATVIDYEESFDKKKLEARFRLLLNRSEEYVKSRDND